MSEIILPNAPKKLPARELVVAPRMPMLEPGKYVGAFTSDLDVVMDCDGKIDDRPCGWHAMGPRKDVKKAYDEHRKQFHYDEIGIVLLNVPRQ